VEDSMLEEKYGFVIGGSFDGAGAWLQDEGVFDSSDDVSDNAASESGWDE
jgi:hypothetical protein